MSEITSRTPCCGEHYREFYEGEWVAETCPFCEIERLRAEVKANSLVRCVHCGYNVPRRWTKPARGGGRICKCEQVIGCGTKALADAVERLERRLSRARDAISECLSCDTLGCEECRKVLRRAWYGDEG